MSIHSTIPFFSLEKIFEFIVCGFPKNQRFFLGKKNLGGNCCVFFCGGEGAAKRLAESEWEREGCARSERGEKAVREAHDGMIIVWNCSEDHKMRKSYQTQNPKNQRFFP